MNKTLWWLIFIFRCSGGQFNISLSSNIDPSKAVSSENVTITRSTKIKAVIRKRGESHRNRDYLEFGCVAMVTLRDRFSLRCNRVVLFYTRVLGAFWRKKDVFESHSNCNGRRMLCWKSLKLFSSMIHHFNVILDEWIKTFWNRSSFIYFCWFCFESNFRKTSEAIEYKNFIILPKQKISGILTPAILSERIQSLLDSIASWIN